MVTQHTASSTTGAKPQKSKDSQANTPSDDILQKIQIQNFYRVLSYCDCLLEQDYDDHKIKNFDFERFQSILDVLGDILFKYLKIQTKRGLGRDYISCEEDLSSPRGKIHITESIRPRNLMHKRLRCSYDVMSVDTKMNQIVKSTALLLLKYNISLKTKQKLKAQLLYFSEVDVIDLRFVDWNIRYSHINISYKKVIEVCRWIVDGWTQLEHDGADPIKLEEYIFKKMKYADIFEQFLRNYFKVHYGDQLDEVSDRWLNWSATQVKGEGDLLPGMHTDIYLQKDNTVLIIDAKFYVHTLTKNNHINSNNLYQIFSYVKNVDHEHKNDGYEVSGMLLYVKPHSSSNENSEGQDSTKKLECRYDMCGSSIEVRTLDMDRPFDEYTQELDEIIREYFGGDLVKQEVRNVLS